MEKLHKREIEALGDAIDSAIAGFEGEFKGFSERVINRLRPILAKLSTDANGYIKPTVANLKIINAARRELQSAFADPKYKKAVQKLVAGFESIETAAISWFSTMVATDSVTRKAVFQAIRETAIEATTETLLGAGVNQALIKPVEALLQRSVTSGAAITDMYNELQLFIVGSKENLGEIQKYTTQIVNDAVSQFSRNYINAISEDLGLQFYLYEGIKKPTSRPFCVERNDKFYHKKEIESWADESWVGKIPKTNESSIFHYVGGYNCRHILLPVDASIVPQSVIDRNISNGNYKIK